MDSRKYLEIISIPFVFLIIVNLLYPFFGYTAFSLFSNGIYSFFTLFGIISLIISVLIYSYVTWRVINEKDSTAAEAAFAGALLSVFVSIASYLAYLLITFLVASLNLAPNSLFSTTLLVQFMTQYLNPIYLVLGVIFGVITSFLGGFFGFIWGKIQPTLRRVIRSAVNEGRIGHKHMKLIESNIRSEINHAITVMKNTRKKLFKRSQKKKKSRSN